MGKGKKRGIAPFFQSAKCKVQSANVVSLRDGINVCDAMDPGLRRDDTREQSSKCKVQMWCRVCDTYYSLDRHGRDAPSR